MKKVILGILFLTSIGAVFAQDASVPAEEIVQEKCTIEEKGVQDMINEFLSAKGWVAGENVKGDKKFFVATGTGVIQAPRSKRAAYIGSRVNAFNKAMLEAKKNMVEFLEVSIKSETERSYQEGDILNSEEAQAKGEDPNSLAYKLKSLVHAKLDKELRAEGVDPDAANKEAAAKAAKKLLASEQYRKMVRTAAQAQVVGLQAICTFEGTPSSDKGEIGVVAIWSPKLQEMAASIITGLPVAKGKAKRPIREQIATDPGALLSTFGVQQKIDEQGDLVLVGFGQAGGVSESKMAAKGAQGKAKANALAAIREFAGENVAVTTDMLSAESTEEFENAAEEYQDQSAFSERIRATAAKMNISGIAVLKNWKFKHPLTGTTVYGCVCTWAPKQATSAKQMKNMMANPTSAVGTNRSTAKPVAKPTASSYGAGGQAGDDDAF